MKEGFYHDIHRRFSDTEYGHKLEANIRFGDFKPDYVPNDTWEELLGDDVNNLRHMPHTYEIAKRFTIYERIGSEALKLAAISHDWGEAVVGDVALPDKEAAGNDQHEIDAYEQIGRELLGDDYWIIDQVPAIAFTGDHELSEPFNAIEYIGYCQTGLKAGKMACLLAGGVIKLPELSRAQGDGLVGGLLALNKMVELKNFKKLAGYAEKYPSIPRLL